VYPTLPEDERAENSAYASEPLDDHEKVSAEPEELNQNTAGDSDAKGATDRTGSSGGGASNTAGRRDGGATSGTGGGTGGVNAQPGGPSGDAAAAGRANPNSPAKKNSSGGGAGSNLGAAAGLAGGIGAGSSGGGGSLSSRTKKRLGIALATALVSGLLAFVSFFGLLTEELVHIEENIVHYFDKRMEHSISQRAGSHWQQVMGKVKGRKGAGDTDTGDPIYDADANYDISELDSTAGLTANYDSAGNITSFTDSAGDKLDASNSALDDPGSPLMEDITSHEPEIDFYRESIRSFTLDDAWGIVRKFLPSREDDASENPTEINKELEQNFKATTENTNGAPETESSEEEEAKSDLGGEVSTAETDASAAVTPGASTVFQICGAEGISQTMKKTLWIIRVAQLMRISNGIVLPTAHQLKVGDLKAGWLAAFMKFFSGFSKAGGWQNLDPSTKTNQVSDTEKSKFAAEPSGTLVSVTNALDTTAPVCGPINSTGILGPILADLFALDPEEEGIFAAVAAATSTIAKDIAGSQVIGYIANEATSAIDQPIIDLTTATGADLVDATISGYDNYSNENAMSNGGERLSGPAVALLDNEADHDDIQSAQQKGPLYALFSPNYDRSLTSTLILKSPTSTSDIADSFNSALATISSPFSPAQLSTVGSFISSRIPLANADNRASDSEDPSGWGVPQFGIPDSLLAEYPDPEANEKWVINYICANPDPQDNAADTASNAGLYSGQCAGTSTDDSGELTGQNDSHQDPFHDFVRLCLAPTDYGSQDYLNNSECTDETTEVYQRFRVYRFDLGVANMINSYNNTNDDQNPNGASTTPTPTTGPTGSLPTGTAQSLAKDILSNPNVGYEFDAKTDMEDAANGQPGTCHVALSQNLLALLDYLSKDGTTFSISALESSCTGHDGTPSGPDEDPHYAGRAADIVNVNGDPTADSGIGRTPNDIKVMEALAPLMPPSPDTTNWTLWSGFGQAECGTDPTLPADIHQFDDICSHLHIQVSQ